jgi:hypothetical protein
MNRAMQAILFVSVLALSAATFMRGQSEAAATPGRFRLVPATVDIGKGATIATLYRVDTATGRTWFYNTGIDKQQHVFNQWIEIPQP